MTEPNPSYHGVQLTKAVGALAYIIKIRVTLMRDTGSTISPFHSSLFLQGLETLSMRVDAVTAKEFIDRIKIFSLLANVANVKYLFIHPASTTHSQMNNEELLSSGIKPNTIRLSVGTEHIVDIIDALSQAF